MNEEDESKAMNRDELLELLAKQCDAAASLIAAAEKADEERDRVATACSDLWNEVHKNKRARDFTMYRIMKVLMGRPDPGASSKEAA